MRAPALALALHLWLRHRRGFAIIFAYLAIEIIAVATIPRSVWSRESAAASAAIPLLMIATYLMATFVNADADFAGSQSGYPSYLLTLPIKTRDLALWPMVIGSSAVSGLWVIAALLIFIPRGTAAPIWWPAAMLAATVAWLQAIVWRPMPVPYARAILAVALLPVMIFSGSAAYELGVRESTLVFLYLLTLPGAVSLALSGVSSSRNTVQTEWPWRIGFPVRMAGVADRRQDPFKSAGAAQFWLEWKRNGAMLPLTVAVTCGIFSIPLIFIHEVGPVRLSPPEAGVIEANVCLNALLVMLGLPILFAMALGDGGRKSDILNPDLSLQPFFATRPLTSAELILAKMKSAACSALATWAILLLFVGVWLILPAREGDTSAPLGFLLLRHLTVRQGLIVMLTLACLVGWTWKCQVEKLWIDLSGCRWLVQGYPIVLGIASTALLWFGANCIGSPELVDKFLKWLPGIAWTFGAVKLAVRGCALRAALADKVIAPRAAIGLGAKWLAIAMALFWVIYSVVPPQLAEARYCALTVFLAMPFARILAAPLMLERNRHP